MRARVNLSTTSSACLNPRFQQTLAVVFFFSCAGLFYERYTRIGPLAEPAVQPEVLLHYSCPDNAAEELSKLIPTSIGAPRLLGLTECLLYESQHSFNETITLDSSGLGGRRLAQTPDILADLESFDWFRPISQQNGTDEKVAVVFRSYANFSYSSSQMAWLRTALHELITSGRTFQPIFLVDAQNAELDLNDPAVYAETLAEFVPAELHPIALLFNERTQQAWFPFIGEYRAHYQLYQALQILSYSFPEIEAFWQVEMDARFTDNVAETLRDAEVWSRQQPRKNLWERNGHFYLPRLWNNCYGTFAEHVDNSIGDGGIWGPPPSASEFVDLQHSTVTPPRSDFTWGVDEPADLITFSPIIDPAGTGWTYEDLVSHFRNASLPVPRRMSIVAMTRTSRRLLHAISQSQRETGAWLVPESTPETFALLHGMKAVYVPHYITFSGIEGFLESENMTLDEMVHTGPEGNRAGGEYASFLYCKDKDGRVAADGDAITFLPEPNWLDSSYFWMGGVGRDLWWHYRNGDMCLPRMILHPVKDEGPV